MIYKGIRYKVDEPTYRGPWGSLYIWNELVQQWIFERSLHRSDTAEGAIDQLLRDGFLRK